MKDKNILNQAIPEVGKISTGRFLDGETEQCKTRTGPSNNWRHERFFNNLKEIFDACHSLAVKKNLDYTRVSSDDPFHNFEDNEIAIALRKNKFPVDSVVLNLLYRLGEKRKRLVNIIVTGEMNILTESLEDTLQDLINYHAILLAYLKQNGRLEHKPDLKAANDYLMKEIDSLNEQLKDKDSRLAALLEIKVRQLEDKVKANDNRKSRTRK